MTYSNTINKFSLQINCNFNVHMNDTPNLIRNDPWLEPYGDVIVRRMHKALEREKALAGKGTLQSFASGHLWFGLHRQDKGWLMREWAPNATEIFLIGKFNNWQAKEEFRFKRLEHGNWELKLEEGSITAWGPVQTSCAMGRRRR